MSKSSTNLNGGPAVATTASGSGASAVSFEGAPPARGFFNAIPTPSWTPNPANPSPSGSSWSQGRGRYPSRTSNNPRSHSYLPRRPPQEPRLPVTLGSGGVILPNSDAELAAHRIASAEFAKESDRYNKAANTRSRSTSSSLKRNHRDLNSGNGNFKLNNMNNNVNGGVHVAKAKARRNSLA
jgi:hypothetical protein